MQATRTFSPTHAGHPCMQGTHTCRAPHRTRCPAAGSATLGPPCPPAAAACPPQTTLEGGGAERGGGGEVLWNTGSRGSAERLRMSYICLSTVRRSTFILLENTKQNSAHLAMLSPGCWLWYDAAMQTEAIARQTASRRSSLPSPHTCHALSRMLACYHPDAALALAIGPHTQQVQVVAIQRLALRNAGNRLCSS